MREPFDDFIKKQFGNYSPDVPSHIWENIAAAKRNKKPKGFYINWLNGKGILLLIAATLIGTGGYLFFSAKNNTYVNDVAKNKFSASQINRSNNTSSQKINTQIDKVNSKTETFTNTQPSDKDNNNVTASAGIPTVSVNDNNSSAERSNIQSSSQNKKLKNKIYKDDNVEDKNASPETIIGSENSIAVEKLLSPFIFNNAAEVTNTKKINSLNIKLPDCPTIEKNAAGNKTYWEVYGGPDYAFGNYKTFGDTASTNYLQKRKASTKFSSAFSAGVRYTKVFDNGMSVKTGLNFSQINEKFVYFNPNEIKYITVITTRVVIRAPGDTLYFNDTLQYQQTGTRTKTTYNHYRTIDIPLLIGYELGNGKIHANINAGVIINVYSWYKGDVLDTTYQPVTITTGKGTSVYQYKNNIGVGFLGSVSFYYKLTDKMHLLLEPYFRYNLSPMSKEDLNLQQKFNTAGLRAGVRFDLK